MHLIYVLGNSNRGDHSANCYDNGQQLKCQDNANLLNLVKSDRTGGPRDISIKVVSHLIAAINLYNLQAAYTAIIFT